MALDMFCETAEEMLCRMKGEDDKDRRKKH